MHSDLVRESRDALVSDENLSASDLSRLGTSLSSIFFFFQAEDGIRDHCVTGVQTCALPICGQDYGFVPDVTCAVQYCHFYVRDSQGEKNPPTPYDPYHTRLRAVVLQDAGHQQDRKSTRLNSSHAVISYAVFCLKKKKNDTPH